MATSGENAAKLDIGRVVQRGFDVLGAQFAPSLALSLLLAGLPNGLLAWVGATAAAGSAPNLFNLMSFGPLLVLGWLAATLGGCLLQAALINAALDQLNGIEPDFGRSLARGLRLVLPLLGLSICVGVLTVIGFMLLIVPGIMVYVALIVSAPALVEEGGVFYAIERSRELTRGSRWRLFLLLLLFFVAYLAVLGLAGAAIGDGPILQAIVQGLATAMTASFVAAMTSSLYFELRTNKEGATAGGLAEVFA